VKIGDPVTLDLTSWAGDMKGRQLRIRKLEIAPGGIIDSTATTIVPTFPTSSREPSPNSVQVGFLESRASDTLHAAGKGVTHWVENKGSTPAVLIVADIFKPQLE